MSKDNSTTVIAVPSTSRSEINNDLPENIMELYDEIIEQYDDKNVEESDDKTKKKSKRRVKPCSLKNNNRFRCYWRLVSVLHEMGHTIAKFPCCGSSSAKDKETSTNTAHKHETKTVY